MQRINNKLNTNTYEFWNNYYSNSPDDDRLIIYEWIEEILQKIKFFSILEIGCGSGVGAKHIKNNFQCCYTATDFCESAIQRASKYSDKSFILDISKDEIHSFYDVIIIAETLEHLENPFDVINKCLSKCYYLVLSLPLNEPKECDAEHIWHDINPDSFSQYTIHSCIERNEYFQIIITNDN